MLQVMSYYKYQQDGYYSAKQLRKCEQHHDDFERDISSNWVLNVRKCNWKSETPVFRDGLRLEG